MDLGVQAFSVSPGEVSGAGAGKGLKGKLMGGISKMAHRTPENGAASIVYATLAPELSDWVRTGARRARRGRALAGGAPAGHGTGPLPAPVARDRTLLEPSCGMVIFTGT